MSMRILGDGAMGKNEKKKKKKKREGKEGKEGREGEARKSGSYTKRYDLAPTTGLFVYYIKYSVYCIVHCKVYAGAV